MSVAELKRLQHELSAPPMNNAALRATVLENVTLLERFARSLQQIAAIDDPTLTALLPRLEADGTLDISALIVPRLPSPSAQPAAFATPL